MMRHLNSLNYFFGELSQFGLNPFMFGWDFINNANFKRQRSNVLRYPSDYLIQPLGKPIRNE